jgi:hypothetical protein
MSTVLASFNGQPQGVTQPRVEVRPEVEVVVHINETMNETARQDLTSAIGDLKGVSAAEFCSGRFHLLVVAYDPSHTSSFAILERVRRQGVHAQLVGPI